MQSFNIVKKSPKSKSFRASAIAAKFDIADGDIVERFAADLEMPAQWQVGLIVGASGTGKTTIAKHFFPDSYVCSKEFLGQSVVDDMPDSASVSDIAKAFSSVGFSSPPSWLKPYAVLSNGEKMRVDLARAILENKEMIVFDEFTSVVDRKVAKIAAFATQKAIRRTSKKFIAVSCHEDVEDWLLPDWVFDTNTMTFRLTEGQKKNRPSVRLQLFESKNKTEHWGMFARHHYLSHTHNSAAKTYVAFADGQICGFCSVLHFPHPTVKNIKTIHRLVVFPEHQGLSIGKHILREIGNRVRESGSRLTLVTSNPSLMTSLSVDEFWRCKSKGRKKPHKGKGFKSQGSSRRVTSSWEFIPPSEKKRLYLQHE